MNSAKIVVTAMAGSRIIYRRVHQHYLTERGMRLSAAASAKSFRRSGFKVWIDHHAA